MRRACVIGWPYRAFALAGDSWLLAEPLRHRRQLHQATPLQPGSARRLSEPCSRQTGLSPAATSRYRTRKRHPLVDEARRGRGRDRRRQHIVARGRPTLCDQHRCLWLHDLPRGTRARLAARDAPVVISAPAAPRARSSMDFSKSGVAEVRSSTARVDRADAVAARLRPPRESPRLGERRSVARDAAVLVNTTARSACKGDGSLGMDFAGFHPECVVADIVYVPLETALLRGARRSGLPPSRPRHAAASGRAGLRKMVRVTPRGHRRSFASADRRGIEAR